MSAVEQNTAPAASAEPTTTTSMEPTTTSTLPTETQVTSAPTTESTPNTESNIGEIRTTEATTSDEIKQDAAVATTTTEAAKDTAKDEATTGTATTEEKRPVEPVTEGILGYKPPGLLKLVFSSSFWPSPIKPLTLYRRLTYSKREFWLSDDAVVPQHLDLYLRGEKPEIAHPVVAWASQSGKGLLFFNKKGEASRSKPAHVLALYDASELKKMQPYEFQFKIGTHQHSFKASSDAERDGWYVAIEKAMELSKASKESVRDSEGYKAEMEKLSMYSRLSSGFSFYGLLEEPAWKICRTTTTIVSNKPREPDKPNVMAGNAAAAGGAASNKRSQSVPKKSTDVDNAEGAKRTGSSSSSSGEETKDKKNKSRSTSRGMLGRLKGKKDEVETKREAKKEEKSETKEEKEEEKADAKEGEKTGDTAPMAGGAALDAPSTAERAMGAPVDEKDTETPAAPATATPTTVIPTTADTTTAERPKANKRSSIFGKFGQSWGNMKSPVKEKEQKDAELKPTVPPKDGVSETAPQIPEPNTTATSEPAIETPTVVKPTETAISGEAKPEVVKDTTAGTPGKERSGFLSGFMNKRSRSVSPSTGMKEAPKPAEQTAKPAESTPFATPAEESAPADTTTATEPATTSTEPATEKTTEKAIEEPKKEEKRSSGFLGNISRRASKAFKGSPIANNTPKKENKTTGPVKELSTTETSAEDKKATEGESSIDTSVPASQPQQGSAPVAASA